MDLSVNNINLKNKNVNFKGLDGAYNAKTVPVYKFYTPAHSKDEKVVLEIAVLYKDNKTAQYVTPDKSDFEEFDFKNDVLEIPQSDIRELSSGFGYRYKILDAKTGKIKRYEIDPFKSMDIDKKGNKINVIEQGKFYGISPKGGTMRHSFLDSDVRIDEATGKKAAMNKDFVRNHFNKLGGSIKGLNWLLTNTDELKPYRYFMTTPDIGADKVSSHRYWPSNQYQCSDLQTFKDFNFELFKQGKGYIADGAFTSQGIQSPLVQHVLKWGEQSPFYNMLKIEGNITLGVLPDVEEHGGVDPYEHIGVRLVNPKGDNYDKTKPTYIQFYDDRLLKPESQTDGQFHFDYDKSPEDIYEITSHQDSVQPYAFEIDPNDKKLKAFDNKKAILLSEIAKNQGGYEDFLTFPNYTIGTKNKVAGVTCWDGNVDIIKMNLSNPTHNPENRKGFFDAREYLFGVASYWTEAIQSHLILETAKNPKDFEKIAQANDISNTRLQDIKDSIKNGSFESIITKANSKETSELVQNFPLQSLETSEELSAIFAQPQFKEEFFTPETTKVITDAFDATIKNAIPEDLKDNKDYKAYVVKTYGNEILRYILVSALNPNAIKQDGTIDLAELKKVTLKSLEKVSSLSPNQEREQVISKLEKGLSQNNLGNLEEKIAKELKSISLQDFKMAEALVLQGKGGLNWRFDAAKDIGDLDSVRDKSKTFDKIWNGEIGTPGVQDFWKNFVSRIREHNPSAYIINEVTSLGDFCNIDNDKSMQAFDAQLFEAWEEKGRPNTYEEKPVYAKQVQFLNETNSTTTSEYSQGFNSFSEFAGVNPEKIAGTGNAGNLENLKNKMRVLTTYNQPNSAIFSHMFVSNHDKPSVLHTMPINMSIYMAKDLKAACGNLSDEDKKFAGILLGDNFNLDKISPKALAVGMAMLKTIYALPTTKFNDSEKREMISVLRNLVYGKKDDESKPNYKRSEAFGVKPYEVTIKDLIAKSGISKNEDDLINKTRDFHYAMMKDSMNYYSKLWEVMNACIGTPTLFGGNEFVQTGYETPSKNEYLGIRNEVLHDLKDDDRYKAYYEKMYKISGMYQLPGLSVLRDGTPISLNITKETSDIELIANSANERYRKETGKELGLNEGKLNYFADCALKYITKENNAEEVFANLEAAKNNPKAFAELMKKLEVSPDGGNHEYFAKSIPYVKEAVETKTKQPTFKLQLWPIYRKNAKGEEAISIMSNVGMPYKQASCEKLEQQTVNYPKNIEIKDEKGICPFEDGTELVKVDYDGKKEIGYIVEDGKISRKDGKDIRLTDTVSVFVPKK